MYKTGCALALMVISSLFGSLLCFRYNTAYHDVFPGIMAVLFFTIIWCTCIRPTLYYRRAFGRGPLIKLPVEESSDQPATASDDQEPWNYHLLGEPDHFDRSVTFHLPENRLSEEEPEHNQIDLVGAGEFGSSSLQTLIHSENATVAGDGCAASWRCWSTRSKRSNQFFNLRPRRLARLPPILPATFIIVAYLTYLSGETLLLTDSIAAYLAFVICISLIILGLFCVFKNFAFGLATALVGFYLCLSCTCMFLVPNSLFPHILVEQFLRLTWVEHRLSVLHLHSFGLYDILLQVIWLVSSLTMGLVTLCMVRLKDARELSVATRIQPQVNLPIASQQTIGTAVGAGDDQHLALEMPTSGSIPGPFSFWDRGAAIFSRTSVNSTCLAQLMGAAPPTDNVSLSMADSTASNINAGTVVRPVSEELQPLLANLYRRPNYGGYSTGLPLATSTGTVSSLSMAPNPQSLVPLSRVQLMTGRLRTADGFTRPSPSPAP